MVEAGSRPERLLYSAASGEQRQKPKGGDEAEEGADSGEGSQKMAKKGEELKEEMDSLMDEIDSVLEENAEEFVKNYVQRGGQ
ncbi:MAG: ubiquitin-like protein Pup [Myxococcota bacterium]|nr:ubiquitin-like protein Pup [Myxococcota bacterium]